MMLINFELIMNIMLIMAAIGFGSILFIFPTVAVFMELYGKD